MASIYVEVTFVWLGGGGVGSGVVIGMLNKVSLPTYVPQAHFPTVTSHI